MSGEECPVKLLWELPHPSANLDPPTIRTDGGDWVVSYREPFTDAQTELRFVRPSYFAFTSADEVTQEQLDAYDRVIEIEDSPLPGFVSTRRADGESQLRHLRMFWDDYGALDVYAEGFAAPA